MKMIGVKEQDHPPPRPVELQSSEPEGAKASAANVPQDRPPDKEEKKGAFDLGANLATNQLVEAKGFSKITPEKMYGFEEIVKELKKAKISSSVYPDFNYYMGAACREMGFIDEAIGHFQIALKKGQKPCEAAHLLGCCFRDKGLWNEARQSLERALKVKGISQEKIRKIKDDLALIAAESSRKRSAF
jgi:tetratricopeptide (TPR) repeat protein